MGILSADALKNSKSLQETFTLFSELNNGLGNGQNGYFVSQADAMKEMFKSYKNMQKI